MGSLSRKGSLSRGVSVQEGSLSGGLCLGGLCPGGLCPWGSLSRCFLSGKPLQNRMTGTHHTSFAGVKIFNI